MSENRVIGECYIDLSDEIWVQVNLLSKTVVIICCGNIKVLCWSGRRGSGV